jgi:hypothetical protein
MLQGVVAFFKNDGEEAVAGSLPISTVDCAVGHKDSTNRRALLEVERMFAWKSGGAGAGGERRWRSEKGYRCASSPLS